MIKRLIALVFFTLMLTAGTCNDASKIKVYEHSPDQVCEQNKGFYRQQGEEVLTYLQAKGYYCVSPQDMEYILNKLKQCLDTDSQAVTSNLLVDLLLGNK